MELNIDQGLAMNIFQFAWIQTLENAGKAAEVAVDAANKAAEVGEAAPTASVVPKLLFVLAVLILPFVLGHLLASVLKLKDDGMRISTCLFALFASVAPFVWLSLIHISEPTRPY